MSTWDGYTAAQAAPIYAGFWMRLGAALIDGLIWLVPAIVLNLLLGQVGGVILIVPEWLYFAYLESSERQATPGKMALGIKVVGMNGERISFGRATGRYFAKILSGLILLIGFIMVAFTQRKQGLHDLIAETLVVRG